MKHSERELFIQHVTESPSDLTKWTPVRANLPVINVCLMGKYKVRALLDTGSTNTLISTGLLEKFSPDVKVTPTSLSFAGVAEHGTG